MDSNKEFGKLYISFTDKQFKSICAMIISMATHRCIIDSFFKQKLERNIFTLYSYVIYECKILMKVLKFVCETIRILY